MKGFIALAYALAFNQTAELGQLRQRAVPSLENSNDCCPSLVVAILQPVYYSRVFSSPTVIDPFGTGQTVTLNGPTTLITSATLTTAFTNPMPSSCPVTGITSSTSQNIFPSSSASRTTSPSTSTTSNAVSAPFYLAINGPVVSQRVRRSNDLGRRQDSSNVSPLVIVDLSGRYTNVPNIIPLGRCDEASLLTLSNGMLLQSDTSSAVAKPFGAVSAAVGTLISPPANQVNTTFAIVNGLPTWFPSDGLAPATFFVCSNGLFASFSSLPLDGCQQVGVVPLTFDQCSPRSGSSSPSAVIRTSGTFFSLASISTVLSTASPTNPTTFATTSLSPTQPARTATTAASVRSTASSLHIGSSSTSTTSSLVSVTSSYRSSTTMLSSASLFTTTSSTFSNTVDTTKTLPTTSTTALTTTTITSSSSSSSATPTSTAATELCEAMTQLCAGQSTSDVGFQGPGAPLFVAIYCFFFSGFSGSCQTIATIGPEDTASAAYITGQSISQILAAVANYPNCMLSGPVYYLNSFNNACFI